MIRAFIRVGIDNPVLLNLVFFVVIFAGLGAYWVMPKEEFPEVSTDRVVVTVGFLGASPEEVEDQILRPLEDVIASTDGLRHMYAEAAEGGAMITLEFARGTDVEAARDEVRRAVDTVEDLPDDATAPTVISARIRAQLLHVAVAGDPRRVDLVDSLKDELLGFDGVAEIFEQGAYTRHLQVHLDPSRAAAMQVSPEQVAQALAAAGLGAPAGDLSLGGQGILVRTRKGIRSSDDLARVPLRAQGATFLTVGDVAKVSEVWEPPSVLVRVNGQPAIDLTVLRQGDADALAVVPRLQAWAEARATTMPPGVTLIAHDDSARFVRDRLSTLASNGAVGIGLVAIVLGLFIGWRNAMLVVWGMPVAYLGATLALYLSGTTMNLIAMFGLLLVTGIIVDDAVVIVENVQRHLEMGKSRLQATLDGTEEVFGAVVAATITTCLAFAPLLMLEGLVGTVMRIVPTVVILSLMASLFEAFFVLPGHLAHFAQEAKEEPENAPTRWLKARYAPLLERVTTPRARYVALAGLAAILLASFGLSLTMKRTLTTPGEPLFAFIDVDLPPTVDAARTQAVVEQIEQRVAQDGADLVHFMRARIGEQSMPNALPVQGDRYGQVILGFHNDPDVLDRVQVLLDELQAELRAHPEVTDVTVTTLTGGPPVGRPIDVRVRGRDPDSVLRTSQALTAHLAARPGVSDVRTDLGKGRDAFEVQVDGARASRFGLTEGQIARATRAAIDGEVALELPLDETTTEVRVGYRNPDGRAAVSDLQLASPAGMVRLRQVADVVRTQGVARITRVDGQRAVRVTADLDVDTTSAVAERDALEAAFHALPDATQQTLVYGGESADTEESFARLPFAGALAIALIYAVLAVQFRSYVQPLLILAAVPIGAAGVVLGLFTFGMDISLIAMIGAVGLVGIVVNDSLVLVDFINRLREDGRTPRDAVIEASLVRLRPILITTVTTVLGLLPLALGIAGEEPLLAPMAVAISVGLTFATLLTLAVVPIAYLVVEDVRALVSRDATAGPTH